MVFCLSSADFANCIMEGLAQEVRATAEMPYVIGSSPIPFLLVFRNQYLKGEIQNEKVP